MHYVRGCVDLNGKDEQEKYNGEDDGCSSTNLWGNYQEECICQHEGCNGASTLTFSALTFVVGIFVTKYLYQLLKK